MKSRYSKLYVALLSAMAALPVIVQAQPPTIAGVNTTEMPRVTQAVDGNVVSVVSNTHLAVLDQNAPLGNVADATPMHHMQLILKRSALRQSALDALIAAQHDPHSSSFQRWLTPQEFGSDFGVADSDIAATTAWLVAQGFTVDGVYPNRMQIDFSGTAGQVKSAFHTQEKRYTIQNSSHIANAVDISVPTALKEVVAGVAGLSDLRPQATHTPPEIGRFNPATDKFKIAASSNAQGKPQAIQEFGIRALVPYDLATMYGVNALRARGITGKGITIAVIEAASMIPSDWTNFVAQFGLGSYGGTFAQIQPQAVARTPADVNCIDPDIANPGQDFTETVLDAEWATAIAPGAHIEVASCDDSGQANAFGGTFTAAINLINGTHRPDIISASWLLDEGFTDPASKTAIDLMWSQANAEGISVFVASGDGGTNPSFGGVVIGSFGIDTNSLGTSPNDTMVGGTDTADVLDGTTSKYFSKTMNAVYGTALSYVPEIPWNASCGNTAAANDLGFASALEFCKSQLKSDPEGFSLTSVASSGGPSAVDAKPVWQRLVWGAAKDESRDVPDVSLFAGAYGNATAVILCTAAYPCTPGFSGPVMLEGGTSLSAPMFAGIQALVDQGLAAKGLPADQGNAAPTLYALAAQEYGGAGGTPPASLAACNADNGTTGTAGCVFHNVTRGSISTSCDQPLQPPATPDCYIYGTIPKLDGFNDPTEVGLTSTSATLYTLRTAAYPAQPGWSFASGLGSVNATNLLAAWEKFVYAP